MLLNKVCNHILLANPLQNNYKNFQFGYISYPLESRSYSSCHEANTLKNIVLLEWQHVMYYYE